MATYYHKSFGVYTQNLNNFADILRFFSDNLLLWMKHNLDSYDLIFFCNNYSKPQFLKYKKATNLLYNLTFSVTFVSTDTYDLSDDDYNKLIEYYNILAKNNNKYTITNNSYGYMFGTINGERIFKLSNLSDDQNFYRNWFIGAWTHTVKNYDVYLVSQLNGVDQYAPSFATEFYLMFYNTSIEDQDVRTQRSLSYIFEIDLDSFELQDYFNATITVKNLILFPTMESVWNPDGNHYPIKQSETVTTISDTEELVEIIYQGYVQGTSGTTGVFKDIYYYLTCNIDEAKKWPINKTVKLSFTGEETGEWLTDFYIYTDDYTSEEVKTETTTDEDTGITTTKTTTYKYTYRMCYLMNTLYNISDYIYYFDLSNFDYTYVINNMRVCLFSIYADNICCWFEQYDNNGSISFRSINTIPFRALFLVLEGLEYSTNYVNTPSIYTTLADEDIYLDSIELTDDTYNDEIKSLYFLHLVYGTFWIYGNTAYDDAIDIDVQMLYTNTYDALVSAAKKIGFDYEEISEDLEEQYSDSENLQSLYLSQVISITSNLDNIFCNSSNNWRDKYLYNYNSRADGDDLDDDNYEDVDNYDNDDFKYINDVVYIGNDDKLLNFISFLGEYVIKKIELIEPYSDTLIYEIDDYVNSYINIFCVAGNNEITDTFDIRLWTSVNVMKHNTRFAYYITNGIGANDYYKTFRVYSSSNNIDNTSSSNSSYRYYDGRYNGAVEIHEESVLEQRKPGIETYNILYTKASSFLDYLEEHNFKFNDDKDLVVEDNINSFEFNNVIIEQLVKSHLVPILDGSTLRVTLKKVTNKTINSYPFDETGVSFFHIIQQSINYDCSGFTQYNSNEDSSVNGLFSNTYTFNIGHRNKTYSYKYNYTAGLYKILEYYQYYFDKTQKTLKYSDLLRTIAAIIKHPVDSIFSEYSYDYYAKNYIEFSMPTYEASESDSYSENNYYGSGYYCLNIPGRKSFSSSYVKLQDVFGENISVTYNSYTYRSNIDVISSESNETVYSGNIYPYYFSGSSLDDYLVGSMIITSNKSLGIFRKFQDDNGTVFRQMLFTIPTGYNIYISTSRLPGKKIISISNNYNYKSVTGCNELCNPCLATLNNDIDITFRSGDRTTSTTVNFENSLTYLNFSFASEMPLLDSPLNVQYLFNSNNVETGKLAYIKNSIRKDLEFSINNKYTLYYNKGTTTIDINFNTETRYGSSNTNYYYITETEALIIPVLYCSDTLLTNKELEAILISSNRIIGMFTEWQKKSWYELGWVQILMDVLSIILIIVGFVLSIFTAGTSLELSAIGIGILVGGLAVSLAIDIALIFIDDPNTRLILQSIKFGVSFASSIYISFSNPAGYISLATSIVEFGLNISDYFLTLNTNELESEISILNEANEKLAEKKEELQEFYDDYFNTTLKRFNEFQTPYNMVENFYNYCIIYPIDFYDNLVEVTDKYVNNLIYGLHRYDTVNEKI